MIDCAIVAQPKMTFQGWVRGRVISVEAAIGRMDDRLAGEAYCQ